METWKDIKGFEGKYQVSDFGRVRSLDREHIRSSRGNTHTIHYKGVVLRPSTVNNFYQHVYLGNVQKRVHRLVMETFSTPDPKKPYVNHKDGNKHNNKLSNLEWCDKIGNYVHALMMGNMKQSKLSPHTVRCIRKSKKTVEFLSKKYGVAQNTIRRVLSRATWKEVV